MKHLLAVVLMSACVTAPVKKPVPVVVPPVDAAAAPRATVDAFLVAVDAGKFDDVHGLLSASLRERYDAPRLAADFANEPNARQRVDAIRAARSRAFELSDSAASLPLQHGRQLRLVREAAAWKIAALE
ncbi:MAG: hypothetical protein ACO1OB_11270 [Archangium sp.]